MENNIITKNIQIIPENKIDIWDKIPLEIRNLLFYTNEMPPDNLDKIGISLTFSPMNSLNVEKLGTQHDPSTIYFPMLISIPNNINDVPLPERYPKYYKLLPEQKYIYLNWLQNIDQPISEEYRHLFLFGLERKLLINGLSNNKEFDSAWEMILKLRKAVTRQNYLFVANSEKTLLTACFRFNRIDLLQKLNYMFNERSWSYEQILIKYYGNEPIEPFEIIAILNRTDTENRRYFDNAPEIYSEEMAKILFEKTGRSYILANEYITDDNKVKSLILGFNNISFPYDLRQIDLLLPDTINLIDFLKKLHLECHEHTKEIIKNTKKKKM